MPRPFQEELLERLSLARHLGRHRNLLVSATGTGKTVMAAADYARLRTSLRRHRLPFVAHREELLEQSRSTFRHGLRDPSFGEMWGGGQRPTTFDHVFPPFSASTHRESSPSNQITARCRSHEGERPIAIVWQLDHPLPTDLFTSFAAAVA